MKKTEVDVTLAAFLETAAKERFWPVVLVLALALPKLAMPLILCALVKIMSK